MYSNLVNLIDNVISREPPDAVLFSGGIDSTAVLYHAQKYNHNVMGITVGVQGKETSDLVYSRRVATSLNIKEHHVFYVSPEKVKNVTEMAVRILKSFNPEWISSTTTLLLGTMYAKDHGLTSISSGEGADDLFGSFPFFLNWKESLETLDTAIKDRLREIVVMSDVIAKSMNMKYIAPFHDEKVKKAILSIPIEERMMKKDGIKTKFPLRKAYEEILPLISIKRPQTMAFSGSGIYETIRSGGDKITDEEYIDACTSILKFRNKFEYALFKIYRKYFDFDQKNNSGCIHCGSDMGKNRINCKICATLQMHGKEITFDGRDR